MAAQPEGSSERVVHTGESRTAELIRRLERQPDRRELAERLLRIGLTLDPSMSNPVLGQPAWAQRAPNAVAREPGPSAGSEELALLEQALESDGSVSESRLRRLVAEAPQAPASASVLRYLCAFGALERLRAVGGTPALDRKLFESLLALNALAKVDAFGAMDEVLKEEAGAFWLGLADFLRAQPELPLSQRVGGLLALAAAEDAAARGAAARLQQPCLELLAALEEQASDLVLVLEGESGAPPRGAVFTALLLVSGILPLLALLTLLGKLLLGLRQRAGLRLSTQGVLLERRLELCGRTLWDSRRWILRSALVSLHCERRFARAGLYLGLLALVLGTYVGVTLLADGTNVMGGSPRLIASGLLVLSLGIVLHYLATRLWDDVVGRCRLFVVPRRGRSVCLQGVTAEQADAALEFMRHAPRAVSSR